MTPAPTFEDALRAYRIMREDGRLDGAIRELGLDPDVLVRAVADVIGSDATVGEGYVLGLMAGVALGQESVMDTIVLAVMDETPDEPTVPTGPTGPRRVHHLRPGRRPR